MQSGGGREAQADLGEDDRLGAGSRVAGPPVTAQPEPGGASAVVPEDPGPGAERLGSGPVGEHASGLRDPLREVDTTGVRAHDLGGGSFDGGTPQLQARTQTDF
jgi:hypothetical protein